MAISKKQYESLSNERKIKEREREIRKSFSDLPPGKMQLANNLVYQFAVATVTLERLVDEINRGEVIEDFAQGAQRFRRENPALKSYNTTIKSFTALSKSLLDLLPEKTQKEAGEELMNFAARPLKAVSK